jgi:hypothetical protein
MAIDFKTALESELNHIKTQYGILSNKAFLFWFATSILEIEEEAALEAISVEGANDKGIDIFYVDDDEGRIFIAQGKYSKEHNHSAREKDVSTLESSLNWLSNPEALKRDGKPELAQAAIDYLEAKKDGYGIDFLFIYTGPKSINIEKKINVYNQNVENIASRRVFRHYHDNLIKDLWDEIKGGRQRIENGSLKTSDGWIEAEGKFGKALVASVPCSELVRLYKQHGDKLFDRNVRLFLGSRKGSINAGIASTIKDTRDRANF